MKGSLKFFWWKLEVSFSPEVEESLTWRLDEIGIKSYAINRSLQNSQRQTLIVWLPSYEWLDKDREDLVRSLVCLEKVFDKEPLGVKWKKIVHEDWNAKWKNFWEPDPVGKNFLILPSWTALPKIYSNRIILRLDPGNAFGTGAHPTTRLCLEALERNPPLRIAVADIGCGSGILGLASLKLGAKNVMAVDIDSLAVKATSENALRNNFNQEQLSVTQGSIDSLKDQLNGKKVDLLICNILANAIRKLAPDFAKVTSKESQILLSGLLKEQVNDITSFLSTFNWKLIASYERENWSLIYLCKVSD